MKRYLKNLFFVFLLLAYGQVQAADPGSSVPDDSDWMFAMAEQMDEGRYTQALKGAFVSGATQEEVLDVWSQLGYSEDLFLASISEILEQEGLVESVPCVRRCCGSVIEGEKFCERCMRVWCKKLRWLCFCH